MQPYWMAKARSYLGLTEIPGVKNEPTILRWWKAIRAPFADDETPWCAAFVGGVLEECHIRSTRSASARSYLRWGHKMSYPRYGAIAVLWRGKPDGPYGHVGFVAGVDAKGNIMLLGGNQGNKVSINSFAKERVLSYHWPWLPTQSTAGDLPVLASDGVLSQNEA